MNSIVFLLLAVTVTIAHGQLACTPNSVFSDYCNTCTCSEDGQIAVCTKRYCDKNIWNRDGSLRTGWNLRKRSLRSAVLEPKKVCEPSTTFKEYCNTCTCTTDGLSYACTKMYCDKEIWNKDGSLRVSRKFLAPKSIEPKKICSPQSTFKDYCNTCACSDDGLSFVCTKMYCDPEVYNQDGSLKVKTWSSDEPLESKVEKMCTPRSTFKDYCNTCTCSNDGMSYACTDMACDENLWNKDGTKKI